MFKSIRFGDDQYSDEIKENERILAEEENDKMDRLIELSVKCDNMIKIMNRMSEDINRLEREIKIHNEYTKDKLINICEIVENVEGKLQNR